MKRHILGIAIFTFVFASFALAFAYLKASPTRQVTTHIKPILVEQKSTTTSCRKRSKGISYQVVSSQYVADENKVVSKLKISWDGYGEAPDKLYVTTMVSSLDNKKTFGTYQILEEPFDGATEKIFTLVSRNSGNAKINKGTNLYARFSVTDIPAAAEAGEENLKLSDPAPVLYVHGESSIIRK